MLHSTTISSLCLLLLSTISAFSLTNKPLTRRLTSMMASSASSSKLFIVTGSTDGIGKHTAERLAAVADSTIIIHGRKPEKVWSFVEELRRENAKVEGVIGDLSSLAEVHQLAKEIEKNVEKTDGSIVLINNAGVFAPQRKVSKDGLELTFAVNVAAPFLLTSLVLPLIKKRPGSRIINISSISQNGASRVPWDDLQLEKGYNDHNAYCLSKLLMSMFSVELAQQFGSKDLPVIFCDPGTVNTKMLFAGWGACGIDVSTADDEYKLATSDVYAEANGKYYVGCRESRPNTVANDAEQRKRLWTLLEKITGATW